MNRNQIKLDETHERGGSYLGGGAEKETRTQEEELSSGYLATPARTVCTKTSAKSRLVLYSFHLKVIAIWWCITTSRDNSFLFTYLHTSLWSGKYLENCKGKAFLPSTIIL